MSLIDITTKISTATLDADRTADSVTLIAVSKVQPLERVQQVLEQGHRIFGENKVQEAQGKWPDLRAEFPDTQVHLLGPLQSNKVKPAVALFDAIHSLDRPKLATKLASEIQAQGRAPELFVQVNTGAEPQKAGILPADADAFIKECRAMDLPITGLMVIPPADEEAALHFALLRKIATRNGLANLSMGMSNDFEKAIKFGATHVRVGTAIFGARDYG
ncbi:YggS family pyridoxal phosphate enzyme [Amylibacter marinus]|uniref:Pyridoxal phosphate homeostasis protein n=1 Tax=Amylibacter marinus TaxID=1475483 RepID=A0ABQ5VVU2_9RHOB|nr:YggS family pyridoxal phosphate-dependent enzyme [Amylibacter marinus]GLQ35407.1 YggS family pyridoxal phosphate enzyme [Amylibacter marinus]